MVCFLVAAWLLDATANELASLGACFWNCNQKGDGGGGQGSAAEEKRQLEREIQVTSRRICWHWVVRNTSGLGREVRTFYTIGHPHRSSQVSLETVSLAQRCKPQVPNMNSQ